jgi:hypothetical protein
MGLFGSKIDCELCNKPFSKKEGKIFKEDGRGGICHICYAQWMTEGAQCAICHQAVRGTQEVGFFPQKKSLGHYDCGGGRRLR